MSSISPSLETLYLESLNERERKAYSIAKSHLGMSFTLEKSNGYLTWIKEWKQTLTDQTQTLTDQTQTPIH